jgi:hypothetical protein
VPVVELVVVPRDHENGLSRVFRHGSQVNEFEFHDILRVHRDFTASGDGLKLFPKWQVVKSACGASNACLSKCLEILW